MIYFLFKGCFLGAMLRNFAPSSKETFPFRKWDMIGVMVPGTQWMGGNEKTLYEQIAGMQNL